MTYVIAQPCVDLKDRACVDKCPVDCIYEGKRMLYIHPDECVDCGACEPVCPGGAPRAGPARRSARSRPSSTRTTPRRSGRATTTPTSTSSTSSARPAVRPSSGRSTTTTPWSRRCRRRSTTSDPARMRQPVSQRLPDFPWDQLTAYAARARSHPDGIVDLSVGTPGDPTPDVVRRALEAAPDSPGYPQTVGRAETRQAAVDWLERC